MAVDRIGKLGSAQRGLALGVRLRITETGGFGSASILSTSLHKAVRCAPSASLSALLAACRGRRLHARGLRHQREALRHLLGARAEGRHRARLPCLRLQERTKFTFNDEDIAELGAIMKKWRSKADTAEDERRGVAYAIGWMETRVGNVIGTKDDRPGMDFSASGDPTQQDCVDEATNTTSYLTVLAGSRPDQASHRRGTVRQGELSARRFRMDALDRGAGRDGQQTAMGGRQLDLWQRRKPGGRQSRRVVHRQPRRAAETEEVTAGPQP